MTTLERERLQAEAWESLASAARGEKYGVLRIEAGYAALTSGYPSEIWWRSSDSCIAVTEERWAAQMRAAGLDWYGSRTTNVRLDPTHPHRMRYVTVSARLIEDVELVAAGWDVSAA